MAWLGIPMRVTLVTALLAAGCGGTSSAGGCDPITIEALDPAYLVHVLDDDVPLQYTSDPPTSGPHQPSPRISGARSTPLSASLQVGILERGDVLVQYGPELSAPDRTALEALARTGVVVAPNADLPEVVVATAWRAKRICPSLAIDDLDAFIAERAGKGP